MSRAPAVARLAQSVAVPALTWGRTEVDGRAVSYGDAGRGPVVVFAHGWALQPRSYSRPVEHLARFGYRVLAPALPGFGGTPELDRDARDFAGYGAWLARFLDVLGVSEPVVVVGHSFGGGVATAFTRELPERVAAMLLANPVCSLSWARAGDGGSVLEGRPLWEWGWFLGADLFAPGQVAHVLPKVLGDALPNAARHPRAMWRVAHMIRNADLRGDLETIRRLGVPAQVLWSDRDRLIPRAAFEGICRALGVSGVVVEGNHAWLMVDPGELCEALARTLAEAHVEGFAGRTALR